MGEELNTLRKSALSTKNFEERGKIIEKMEELLKKTEKCKFTSQAIKDDPKNWVYEMDESKGYKK